MVHERQRLPLGVEPSQHRTRIQPRLDQLERHLPLDRFRLARQIHQPHAPLADHLNQRVPAGDDGADPFAPREPRRRATASTTTASIRASRPARVPTDAGARFRVRAGIRIRLDRRLRRVFGPVQLGCNRRGDRRVRVERLGGGSSLREIESPGMTGCLFEDAVGAAFAASSRSTSARRSASPPQASTRKPGRCSGESSAAARNTSRTRFGSAAMV